MPDLLLPRFQAPGTSSRIDGRGTRWTHQQCPFCPTRGRGLDRGAHLGIGVAADGRFLVKCFRCGQQGLPRGWSINGRASRGLLPAPGGPDSWSGPPPSRVGSGSLLGALPVMRDIRTLSKGIKEVVLRWCRKNWPAVPAAMLLGMGIQVSVPDPSGSWDMAVGIPCRGIESGGKGLSLRGEGGWRRCYGIEAPWHLPFRGMAGDGPVVLVEACLDGAAVAAAVPEVIPTILGTCTLPESIDLPSLLKGREVIFIPDGDGAGRRGMAKIARNLLRKRYPAPISWVTLEDGSDPAETMDLAVRIDARTRVWDRRMLWELSA